MDPNASNKGIGFSSSSVRTLEWRKFRYAKPPIVHSNEEDFRSIPLVSPVKEKDRD
jgi:hypothetical protein